MFVIIRQHGKTLAAIDTRCRKHLSERAINAAEQWAALLAGMENGYYDITLNPRHDGNPAYDVDSHIAIR